MLSANPIPHLSNLMLAKKVTTSLTNPRPRLSASAMTSKSEAHLPLMSSSLDSFDTESSGNYQDQHDGLTRKPRLFTKREILLLSIISLQAIGLLLLAFSRSSYIHTSPANDVLADQIKVFNDGLTKTTIYQEYSNESDSAWQDLYNGTTMRIPRSEAVLLPNRTWPIQEEPGYYIAQLDVFHQLHCLNKLRQGLRRNRYEPLLREHELAPYHLAHCVDSLRQYLMCHADPAVVIWQWDPKQSKAVPSFDYPHMCKNYEKLREWALDRQISHFDLSVYTESDLPIPPIIY